MSSCNFHITKAPYPPLLSTERAIPIYRKMQERRGGGKRRGRTDYNSVRRGRRRRPHSRSHALAAGGPPTNACATARARASFPPSYAVTIKVMDEKRPFNAEKEQTSGWATQLQVHFIHDKPPRKRRGIEKLWPQLWKKSMICYRRRNMSPFSSTLRMALNSTICVSSSEGTLFEGRTRVAGWICT